MMCSVNIVGTHYACIGKLKLLPVDDSPSQQASITGQVNFVLNIHQKPPGFRNDAIRDRYHEIPREISDHLLNRLLNTYGQTFAGNSSACAVNWQIKFIIYTGFMG